MMDSSERCWWQERLIGLALRSGELSRGCSIR